MIPKYLYIKNELLNEINTGIFSPGDRFYSESELAQKYDVSSITVIRALKELVLDGYLYSVKGKGRFVSQGKNQQLVRFTDVEKYPDHNTDVKVISIQPIDDDTIRQKLSVSGDVTIYEFKRVRLSDGEPFFLQYSYIPETYVKKEDLKHPERFQSIYKKMEIDYNFHLSTSPSIEYYQILFPTPPHVASLLNMNENEPTSFAQRTTFLDNGAIVEYIESYKRWDYYCSKVESTHSVSPPITE
ncbi:GntR family transcriptional regulator [Vagococcus sp. JNUCC 83]